MRTFNFKARNIGEEKYLTYTMGEDCELDEDILDYCEENKLKELIEIIYEEDDDYDYLTYDITKRTPLEELIKNEISCKQVLNILRNVANGLISLKEQAIPLSYVLLNRNFMYIDEQSCDLFFICLPIEVKGSIMAEFKGFMRQLLANMKYDVEEDLGYVGKLLTYINGDNFNLRGLIGLTEALMEEAGISFEEVGTIEADGVEVVNSVEPEEESGTGMTDNLASFMNDISKEDEALPEIGDDEDVTDEEEVVSADEELDSILPTGMDVSEPDEDDTSSDNIEASESEEDTVEADENPVEDVAEDKVEDKVEDTPSVEEADAEETGAEEADDVKPVKQDTTKAASSKAATESAGTTDTNKKETDIDLIKNRIKELVGDVPSAKPVGTIGKNISTIEDLDEMLESKPPVIKRNVVKVNRAAIIQNVAAEEEAAEQNAENDGQVPVIEDIYEDMNIEKDEKPKSKSILSKSVDLLTKPLANSEAAKAVNNLLGAPKAMPYLIRVNTEERIMLNKVNFKLGKASMGVDYTVSGNGAISRQHAVIIQKEGVCYIKDNKSTNHTYVNGKMVEDGSEEILTHDSMIKLGDEEFIFKIR